MKIQDFKADTVSEALLKVRESFGRDALVLSTQARGKLNEGVVITAALPSPGERLQIRSRSEPDLKDALREIRSDIAALRDTFTTGKADLSLSPGVADLERRLRESGVGPRLRRRILELSVRRARGVQILDAASEMIQDLVPIWPSKGFDKKPRIIAFVGPTGAGKTTTLAKLAGRLVYEGKKRVSLITLDTYRVAAVEQIRAYADMLSIPLQVVFTPADTSRAIEKNKDRDVILIDTTGRGPFDAARLQEITSFLAIKSEIESLLVLASTTSPDVAAAVMDRFPLPNLAGLVLTKLDETRKPGSLLELIVERNIPIAYLTAGQEVPTDLERASGEKIARWILSEPELSPKVQEAGI